MLTDGAPASCVLVAELRSGVVESGMMVSIPLNGSVDIAARVVEVTPGEEPGSVNIRLLLESAEGAELFRGLNVSEEELACRG